MRNHSLSFLNPVKNIFFILLSFTICLFTIFQTSKHAHNLKVKDFLPPPPAIEHYSLGLKPQIADALWVRAIQDIDYCENLLAKNLCKSNTWLSKMLLVAVKLDPNFYMVYMSGGLALTVLVSDYEGASQLFDIGVQHYPNDWKLLYAAAYHALYEEKNNKKAADLYLKAAQHGAPSWVYSLANRLYLKSGEIEMTEQIMSVMEKMIKDPEMLEKIRDRIQRKVQPGQQ